MPICAFFSLAVTYYDEVLRYEQKRIEKSHSFQGEEKKRVRQPPEKYILLSQAPTTTVSVYIG